jgi:anti-sigma factor RsiW
MITKTDWDDALDAWVDAERERLGGPPTPEEVVAYLSGELPPAEAARVRSLLVYYPELTPLLTERIEKPRASRRPRALRLYAVAATLVVALLSTDALLQRHRNAQPAAVTSHHVFSPTFTRGAAGGPVYALPAGEARYLLTIVPVETPGEGEHEIELTRESRVLWRARGVHAVDDAFVIDVPGRFLEPGTYTLRVRSGDRLVARYTFRVTE